METKSLNRINKNLYKIFITVTKYIPVTISLLFIIAMAFNYFDNSIWLFEYIGGVSFIFLLLLYLISVVFQYCYIYRIPLYYITVISMISCLDYLIGIPLDNLQMSALYLIITGIAILFYIYLEYKSRLRKH